MRVKKKNQEFSCIGVSALEMMIIIVVLGILVGVVGLTIIQYINI